MCVVLGLGTHRGTNMMSFLPDAENSIWLSFSPLPHSTDGGETRKGKERSKPWSLCACLVSEDPGEK